MKKSRTSAIFHKNLFALGCVLLNAATAFASPAIPIGRITHLEKKYWRVRVNGDRDAASQDIVREGDTLQTIAGQSMVILLVDGTELLVGPSSRVVFTNWTQRDSDMRLVRTVTLLTGMLKAKVKKVYSQLEPFVVVHRYGAVAVRGTEFLVESGSGGRLAQARRLSEADLKIRPYEVEVHTLEGEVHFAKDIESLDSDAHRVSLMAGQTSVIRWGMVRPQSPHSFDLSRFQKYIAKATPKARLEVVRNTTNSERAELAAHSRPELRDMVSPARPVYAEIQNRGEFDSGRGPASSSKQRGPSPISRRKLFMREKPIQTARKDRGLSSDLVHDAFSGGDELRSIREKSAFGNALSNRSVNVPASESQLQRVPASSTPMERVRQAQ